MITVFSFLDSLQSGSAPVGKALTLLKTGISSDVPLDFAIPFFGDITAMRRDMG